MSADLLRRAAALMRERAQSVGGEGYWPSPWESVHHLGKGRILDSEQDDVLDYDWIDAGLADHIASWHPAVALAVADLLDDSALSWDRYIEAGGGRAAEYPRWHNAIVVARAYLEEES